VPRIYIGGRLRKLREQCGMTQTAFADALGVHWRNVQDWEKERTAVDIFKAEALLKAAERVARPVVHTRGRKK